MKSATYAINSTAVKIVPAQHFERTVLVHCSTGTAHLGDATVTTVTGLPIANGEAFSITIPINETLYAIDGGGTATIFVLDASAD